jgi:TM2 domain-containing membrane protein YozV
MPSIVLQVLEGPLQGRTFSLEAAEIQLGRDNDSGIDLSAYQQVSRQHARFYSDGAAVLVQDLGSTNGVYLNGNRIAGPSRLTDGATLKLGDFVARVGLPGIGGPVSPSNAPTQLQPHAYPSSPSPISPSPAAPPPAWSSPPPTSLQPYSPAPPPQAYPQQAYPPQPYPQQGYPQQPYPPQPGGPPVFYKNPSIAALLSVLWPGAGQIYNGEMAKGIPMLCIHLSAVFGLLCCIAWVVWPVLWIWSIVDAYQSAEKINRQLSSGSPY